MARDYAETIGLLMDKAQRTDSEEEALSLRDKIAEMMAKHSIDEAMVSAKRRAEGRSHENDEMVEVRITYRGQYAQALRYWTGTIGEVFGCKVVWYGTRKRTIQHTSLVGFRSDVEQAKALIESLQLQMLLPLRRMQADQLTRFYPTTVAAFIERRSFVQGFADGAASKIHNVRRELGEGSSAPGTGLVLYDRSAAVDKFYADKHPDIKPNKRKGIDHSARGYNLGHAEGRQADVGGRKAQREIG